MGGRRDGEGLEEGLRLVALVFYVVGVFVVLATVNRPLSADEDLRGTNRGALNALAAAAVVSAFATFYAPWRRLPRDVFFAGPAAGVVLISVCASFSGGWDSFAYVLYVLPASFFGLYFPSKATAGLCFLVLSGASPFFYDPDASELAQYGVVYVPVFAAVTFVSSYVVREFERKEAARRAFEDELVAEKARAIELRRMTDTDGLTGLKNRRGFRTRLAEEIERSRRLGRSFSLLFMDLDDFKAINDEHGHLPRRRRGPAARGPRPRGALAARGHDGPLRGRGVCRTATGHGPGGDKDLLREGPREAPRALPGRTGFLPAPERGRRLLGGRRGRRGAHRGRRPGHVLGEAGRQKPGLMGRC